MRADLSIRNGKEVRFERMRTNYRAGRKEGQKIEFDALGNRILHTVQQSGDATDVLETEKIG